MDWLLSWYTFYAVIAMLVSGGVAIWFLGLWPVIAATLSTSAGRKASLVAAGGFLLWVASIFLYQRGKQAANEALRKNSERLEDERNARDQELKSLPADDLRKRADKWVR